MGEDTKVQTSFNEKTGHTEIFCHEKHNIIEVIALTYQQHRPGWPAVNPIEVNMKWPISVGFQRDNKII